MKKQKTYAARYKYQGARQTVAIVEQLILTLFAGTPEIKREYILKGVLEFHKSQGGLVCTASPYITTALRKLEKKGFAEQLRHGYWRILSIYDYDSET